MIAAVLIVGGAVSFFAFVPPLSQKTSTASTTSQSPSCPAQTPAKDQTLSSKAFDAVIEFTLPSLLSSPNAITVAPDGSVWFGENGLPGVGHLYPNGTLNEYRLPFSTNSEVSVCGELANIWGVAFWNGSAWAANENQPQLEGVNPATGAITNVTLKSETSPYTLAVGPDGDLWFTQVAGGPEIGRVAPGTYAVKYYQLPGNDSWLSAYVAFQNRTLGYVLAINPISAAVSPNAITSIVYSFDPESPTPAFQQVGSNTTLYEPSSIAVGEGGLWLTEHDGTGMAFFNATSSTWTIYPTSTVPYVPFTLTYFDASNGTTVWFNEHYADKIGAISDGGTRLTEYSVSNPPVNNLSLIPNTLTMAIGDDRTWFTQWTGNVVGFVNQSYVPPFATSTTNESVQIQAGSSARVQLQVSGHDSRSLSIQFSDSEFNNGTAKDIAFTPSPVVLPSLDGTQTLSVGISVGSQLRPGDYVAAITVTDGLVLSSVYVTITVTG